MNMKYWLSCPYSDDTDCFTINGIYLVPEKNGKFSKNWSRNRAYVDLFFGLRKVYEKNCSFGPPLHFKSCYPTKLWVLIKFAESDPI